METPLTPVSSDNLTLVVESESGGTQEFFAQVGLSLGRAKSNTVHINHPDVDRIHAKVVKRGDAFWLRAEPPAKLPLLDPEPKEVEETELFPGLSLMLGGVHIRCRRHAQSTAALSDDYWADAAGGDRFRVESDAFTGELPKKIGPYEIRKFVARGGMGIVLRGIHSDTDQPAAVKLPTPDLNEDRQWLKRFEQEVRTLKSVTHPNLVRLQDAGTEGDLHWMAMDWVEGWTVGERLAVYKETGEQMPLEEIQLVLRQVVEGLMTLHSHGIVHRDLKPGNLLVGQDGSVKVADFGLAKQIGAEQSTMLTRTGTMAGTMHYMAPEQIECADITPITDVYALGVIWHELLTGKRPSGKFKLSKLRPDTPTQWVSLIEDCLDDESDERPTLALILESLLPANISAGARADEPKPPREHAVKNPGQPTQGDLSDAMGIIGASAGRWARNTADSASRHATTVKDKLAALKNDRQQAGLDESHDSSHEPNETSKTPWWRYRLTARSFWKLLTLFQISSPIIVVLSFIEIESIIITGLFTFIMGVIVTQQSNSRKLKWGMIAGLSMIALPVMESLLIGAAGWSTSEAQRILPWLLIFAYGGVACLIYPTKDELRVTRENEPEPQSVDQPPPATPWLTYALVGMGLLVPLLIRATNIYYLDPQALLYLTFAENFSTQSLSFSQFFSISIFVSLLFGPMLANGHFYGPEGLILWAINLAVLWGFGKTVECNYNRNTLFKLTGAALVYCSVFSSLTLLAAQAAPKLPESVILPITVSFFIFRSGFALLLPLAGFLWMAHKINPGKYERGPIWAYCLLFIALVGFLLLPVRYHEIEGMLAIGSILTLLWATQVAVGAGLAYLKYRPQKPTKPCPDCGKDMFKTPRGNWTCMHC